MKWGIKDHPAGVTRSTGGESVNHTQQASKVGEHVHATRQASSVGESYLRTTLGLRHLGVLLPMLINYGHLLLSGCRPHWAPVTLSLGVAALSFVLLYERGDRRGAGWVGVLFVPLNAWPIVFAAMGGAA